MPLQQRPITKEAYCNSCGKRVLCSSVMSRDGQQVRWACPDCLDAVLGDEAYWCLILEDVEADSTSLSIAARKEEKQRRGGKHDA